MSVPMRFVGEPIEVDVSSMAVRGLAGGQPACPRRFSRRNRQWHVAEVLETTRVRSADGYVRRPRFLRRR